MTSLVEALKTRIVAAELSKIGITDRTKVVAIAARTRVENDGSIVGLDAHGNPGVGTGPSYQLSIADVARDLGETGTDETAHDKPSVILDPAQKGFNLSAAIIAARSDPAAHEELLARLAPKPLRLT